MRPVITINFIVKFIPGMGKHFLRRAALKILLLTRAACSYYIYYIYNRFENFKKVLHEIPQSENNNSQFRLSKNAVSNETCGKNLGNSRLIDKITLTLTPNMCYLCTCDLPCGPHKMSSRAACGPRL